MTDPAPTPPESRLTTLVASVIAGVLSVDVPAPDANFFALGGDSLAALEVIALLQEELAVEVPLDLIFDFPVLAEFAAELERLCAASSPGVEGGVPTA